VTSLKSLKKSMESRTRKMDARLMDDVLRSSPFVAKDTQKIPAGGLISLDQLPTAALGAGVFDDPAALRATSTSVASGTSGKKSIR